MEQQVEGKLRAVVSTGSGEGASALSCVPALSFPSPSPTLNLPISIFIKRDVVGMLTAAFSRWA